ncbi:MAG TPA: DUF4097 family beta strand repeat-containing protein [Bacilli bacterium]|nr:DUF4097 family beta strand repeat-containing protein [Bacilli bacterium]
MIKKAVIIPLIVGGSLILFGGIVAAISVAAAGGFAALSTAEPYVSRVIDAPADLNINVEEQNNQIVIITSATATSVSITVQENNYETYTSTADGTDFTLVYQNNIPWMKHLFYIPLSLRTMTITVPASYVASLDISNTNGVIDADDISLAGKLTLETANGVISVNKVTATGNIDVRTTNSKIEVVDSTSAGNITAHSMNGYILLHGLNGADITGQTTNGKIVAQEIVAQNLKVVTTNGGVVTSDIDVDVKIHLETTNGGIVGNVKGPSSDYDVDSRTTNGSNNLSGYNSQTPTTDNKILYARCYNGDISITFK